MENPFETIYRLNLWKGTESLSGQGSSLEATKEISEKLLVFVEEYDIQGVLDMACGDGWWMPNLPDYIGMDHVPLAIERAKRFHPDREYLLKDIRDEDLPKRDLVILRDVIQHITLADGVKVIQNIKASGARWLAASTYISGENIDIPEGGFYVPDMKEEPFNLGEEVEGWPDGNFFGDWSKLLGIWKL